MKRFPHLFLAAAVSLSMFLLSALPASAKCDPYDTRLCTDGPAYEAGGVAKVSYIYDRYMLGQAGGMPGLGGPAGWGGSIGQAAPAEGPGPSS